MNIDEMKDRIARAEEIQRYTENRCEALEKENAELKSRDCWKSCEYANPKAELIEQHIKDVQNLTKAKKIIKKLYSYVFRGMEFMELNDFNVLKAEAEQFISEVKNDIQSSNNNR